MLQKNFALKFPESRNALQVNSVYGVYATSKRYREVSLHRDVQISRCRNVDDSIEQPLLFAAPKGYLQVELDCIAANNCKDGI